MIKIIVMSFIVKKTCTLEKELDEIIQVVSPKAKMNKNQRTHVLPKKLFKK